jgi:hypothetical protein
MPKCFLSVMNMSLCTLGVYLVALLGGPASGQNLDQKLCKEDSALATRVSIPCGRYAIGELLEKLASESSVTLESGDPYDGGSGFEVTVCLKNVPLSDAMSALYALMSYKKHEWRWTRMGKEGHFIYKLTRPFEARTLRDELKAWAQRALMKQASKLVEALQLSPEELKQAAAKDSLLKGFAESPRMQDGIEAFSSLLSPETQAAVLNGAASPQLQVSQLDARGQQFVRDQWKKAGGFSVRADGSEFPTPEPTWIQFHVSPGNSPAPTMYIELEGLGGYGYFGGNALNNDFRNYFASLWLLPGDDAHTALEQQTLKRKPGMVIKDSTRVMEARLGELSEATPLSFMARLPEDQTNDPHQLAGVPLGEIFRIFRGTGYELQSKWRAGTLLLTDDRLYLDDPLNPAPWIAVKRLRGMRERSHGFFTWSDLVVIAHDYDSDLLERLSKEFPVTKSLMNYQDLFRSFYGETYRAKQLFSREGLPLLYVRNLLYGTAFAQLLEMSPEGKQPVNIRVIEEFLPVGGKRANMIRFESLDDKGNVIKKRGFYNVEQ